MVGTEGVCWELGDVDEEITTVGEDTKGEEEVNEMVGDREGMGTRGTYGATSQVIRVGTSWIDGRVAGKEYVTAGNIEEEVTAGGGVGRGTEEQAIESYRESRAKVLIGGL